MFLGSLGIGELVLADVEAGPVYGGGGAGEGGVGVPEEGGDVGEVTVFFFLVRALNLGFGIRGSEEGRLPDLLL